MSSLQVQQLAVKSDVKSDLLAALAKVSHTGVYGLEVCPSEPRSVVYLQRLASVQKKKFST